MVGVCGALNDVSIVNNTLHGASGVNSNDDNGIDGYSCSGNLTNVVYSETPSTTSADVGTRLAVFQATASLPTAFATRRRSTTLLRRGRQCQHLRRAGWPLGVRFRQRYFSVQ